MSSYVTPKRATAYKFFVELRSQANTKLFQVNPTLAAGDVKVSKDGGAFANLTTLPAVTPAAGRSVQVDLDATEMTADNVKVIFSDAAGAEWCDLSILIQTTARQIDDLAFPNTSGRGIDVSAGGEVGLDWANIGSPTTTQLLSGTTIKTATDVETDTQDIQSRLPAALVSGRIDASVGAMAANVLTATAIASDAITDAKVASDVTIASVTGSVGSVTGAVGSVTGAVGSVTGNVGGNVVGSVGSVTAGVTLADDAITAGKFDETTAFPVKSADTGSTQIARVGADGDTLETLSDQLDAVKSDTAAILVDTGTTLDGKIDAIKLVTDKLDDTLEDDGGTFRFTANALEEAPTDGSAPTAAAIADAVWEEAIADHSGTAGSTAEQLAAAGSAGDPWATALPGAYTSGQAGNIVGTALDDTISSRAAAGDAMTLTSGERAALAAALLDLSNAIETGVTLREAQRLMLSALGGLVSGAGTPTITFRNAVADSKNRIIATVDGLGNRTAMTTDLT